MFSIGEHVIHPGQGVCTVTGFDEDAPTPMIILECKQGHAKTRMMYPLAQSDRLHLAISREEAENRPLFAYLRHSLLWLDACEADFSNFHLVFLMRLSRFLGLYPNLEHYRAGDYFDLRAACFTPVRPSAHADCLPPAEASHLARLMRMNYDTMRFFRLSRAERARCLEVILSYYRLHVPAFPVLRSPEVLKELFD